LSHSDPNSPPVDPQKLRAWVDYYRDLGIHTFYRNGEPAVALEPESNILEDLSAVAEDSLPDATQKFQAPAPTPSFQEPDIARPTSAQLISFDQLAPLPTAVIAPAKKAAALEVIREELIAPDGTLCTRCALAYAGRNKVVFADGDPNAELMFVGEGPGADEDVQGLPFVGRAGQLLNNMITAMGLSREQVYIANIVKCRPPSNRVPEPAEANTCSPFLLRQIDTVRPKVIVALGATAATYLLGRKAALSLLRGSWHTCRGAKLAVTYHPAFLLRDPRQKKETWKDLQMVMAELGLKPSKTALPPE
jgi:uracil-DNA glycosylase family 4